MSLGHSASPWQWCWLFIGKFLENMAVMCCTVASLVIKFIVISRLVAMVIWEVKLMTSALFLHGSTPAL